MKKENVLIWRSPSYSEIFTTENYLLPKLNYQILICKTLFALLLSILLVVVVCIIIFTKLFLILSSILLALLYLIFVVNKHLIICSKICRSILATEYEVCSVTVNKIYLDVRGKLHAIVMVDGLDVGKFLVSKESAEIIKEHEDKGLLIKANYATYTEVFTSDI